ncbi:MAG TPA: hypothetical protein VEJ46_04560 [Candidatus Acidoferrum sp.]|nr:hypothetical protein [Candidatus Acidoferrum sp.]
MNYWPPLRIVGWINLILAASGYCQLLVNVVGYYGLPASFIDEYGPFMRGRFPAMSILSAILLALLAVSGFLLLRRLKGAILFGKAVFVMEIIAIAIICARWNFAVSFLSLPTIAAGLMNGAIAIQIVTLYPIVGLIVLSRGQWNPQAGAEPA